MQFLTCFQDEQVSRSKTRYYANSLQHRIKNRIWQTLLVLLPKLDQVLLFTRNFLNFFLKSAFNNTLSYKLNALIVAWYRRQLISVTDETFCVI